MWPLSLIYHPGEQLKLFAEEQCVGDLVAGELEPLQTQVCFLSHQVTTDIRNGLDFSSVSIPNH